MIYLLNRCGILKHDCKTNFFESLDEAIREIYNHTNQILSPLEKQELGYGTDLLTIRNRINTYMYYDNGEFSYNIKEIQNLKFVDTDELTKA